MIEQINFGLFGRLCVCPFIKNSLSTELGTGFGKNMTLLVKTGFPIFQMT